MARQFKDHFQALFGRPPKEYDPVEWGERPKKRALDIQESVPEIDAGGIPYKAPPKAIDPEQGVGGNLIDLTKTGAALGAEAVVGAVEYGTRQLARREPGVVRDVLESATEGLTSVRGKLSAYRQSVYDLMPSEAVEMRGREFLTLDPDKTIWKGGAADVGEAVLYKFWESLPMMVGTIVPGAVMMRLAVPGAITYLGASEGGLSVGFIQNEIADGIAAMSEEELVQEAPRYVELLEGMAPEDARRQFTAEAQGMAPIVGGVLVGAVSAAAGRYLQPVITGKSNLGPLGRAGAGAVSEGVFQEGPQEVFEQVAQNVAAAVYDGDRDALEGAAEAYVQGAVIGAPAGALVGAAIGKGEETIPPSATPEDRDRPGAPSSFRDVFGEQVPGPDDYTGAPATDLFPTPVDITDEAVPPDHAAAIAAAMRADEVMDDMVDNIESATPEAQAQQNLPLTGGAMAGPGRDLVPITPQPPTLEGQGELPLVQRNRGIPPQNVSGDSEAINRMMGIPRRTDVTDPRAVPGAPAAPVPKLGTNIPTEQQGDLFDPVPRGRLPQPTAPVAPTAGEFPAAETDGFVVTMTDDTGNVIEQDIFNTAEEANTVADELADGFPDANINVTRTRAPRQAPAAAPAAPDQPTAEPLSDIQAQLVDLASDKTSREGVYLSADNLARLERDGVRDQIGETGVHLVNFDNKGGLLIVKSEEVAASVQDLKQGGFPMQYILGQVTRAGAGKPMGDTVVQVRDKAGAVIRETLVASEDEAFALAEEIGDSAVVLTSAQALKRREQLIEKESKQQGKVRQKREAGQKARAAISKELPEKEQAEAEGVVEGASSPSKAAARLLGLASRRGKLEEQKRVAGFFPPDTLEFESETVEAAYREAFGKLLDAELVTQQPREPGQLRDKKVIDAISKAFDDRKKYIAQLGKIRQIHKPKRRTTRVVKAAAGTDVSTVSALKRDVSKKAKEIDTSAQDYFVGEKFEPLDRQEIDNLEGAELSTAFGAAAYWLAGQYRNVEISPEWLIDHPEAAEQEIAGIVSKAKGDPLAALTAAYDTPGKQKKLIRRTMVYYKRRKYGGKIAARGVTAKAKGQRTTTAEFDTGVLTRDTQKQDEKRSDQIKREARSSKARKTLTVAVRQSGKLIQRFENSRSTFGKAIAEIDSDGKATEEASNLRVAKAYFVALNEFALSLIQSGQNTNEANLVMERLNSRLREITKLSPSQFATRVSKLARADEQSSLLTIADPGVRAQVTSPAGRANTLAKYYDELIGGIARRARMENVWKKNAFYNNLVGPLMNKFVDSISTDGWASYRPNQMEMEGLAYAMRGWRLGDERVRRELYDPLKRFFRGVGITFAEEKQKGAGGDVVVTYDEDGNYQYSPNDEALEKLLEIKIGKETQETYEEVRFGRGQLGADAFNAQREATIRQREESATRADEREDSRQAQILKNANRAINALLKIVGNKKSTITKIATAEQNFIRKMRQLGIWEDVSPALGRIVAGVPKRYHRVAARLLSKKLSKQEARDIINRFTPFAIPKGLETAKLTLTQAEKDLDLAMEAIDPQGNATEFEAATTAVGDLLNNRNQPATMAQVLQAMLSHLPENHLYRALAKKLQALGIRDVTVSYDWDGKELGDNAGGFRVRDRGQRRSILLNRKDFSAARALGENIDARILHVLLHEMVHAATHRALKNNPALRRVVLELRDEALRGYGGGTRPYGLVTKADKAGTQIPDEFIAEAFSNPEFQARLKQIHLDGISLWQRFLNVVRRALGLKDSTPISVMDIITSMESELFRRAAGVTAAEDVTLNIDGAMRPHISQALDRLNMGVGRMKGFWDRVRPPLIAMTMEQVRDTYVKHFGAVGDPNNPLRKYMDAFFKRNAENTRLMEVAEKVTRRWTALDEKEGGEAGTEFSALATDATMQEVSAANPLSHKLNEHLKSDKQKARHRELHNRFKKMSEARKKLYYDLQKYYRETLEREVDLMIHNALRGLLTTGEGGQILTVKEFEAKYSVEQLKAFDTKEKFNEEFGQYFDENRRKEMLSTLHQMANVRQKRRGDYFPLKRYGEYVAFSEKEIERKIFDNSQEAYGYAAERRGDDVTLTVDVKKQDNGSFRVKVVEKDFRTAETPSKAARMRDDMIEQYGEQAVSTVQKMTKEIRESHITSNSQLNAIINSLSGNTAAQAAIKQFYLDQLDNASFRKHEMRRKNRRGVETNLQLRNFTQYAKQSSYYTAQLLYGSKLAQAMADMRKFMRAHRDESEITTVRLNEVYNTIKIRDEMTSDITVINRFAKRSVELTQFMMLTSPSYWMINTSQSWMVTLPYLTAKYGMMRSLASMKNAQKLIASPLLHAAGETKGGLSAIFSKAKAEKAFNVLEDVKQHIRERDPANAAQYNEMLEKLREMSVIDLSWIAELRDISEGTDTGLRQKVLDASRIMAHLTEVNNRILTAIATYDLAKQKALEVGIDEPTAHLVGIKEALASTSLTQFNYSSPNKPPLFQKALGPMSPMVFQFMQYPQHLYALMITNFHRAVKGGQMEREEARRLLLGLFGTHMIAGGLLSITLQPVKWAIGAVLMAFGDEGEDTLKGAISGENSDRMMTKLMTDLFGSTIGTLLIKGAPTLVGADLSQRMSLGTVYFLDFRGNNAESAIGSLILGLGGASVNLAANFWRGGQHFIDGNYQRAIESASPKILRDVIRAQRYWSEGLVNNAGDTVIASEGLSPVDLFLQALGIQPIKVSKYYGGQAAIKDKEIYFREKKSDILKDFRKSVGDPAAMAAVLRNVAEFNRRNPAIGITRSALVQSAFGQKERESRYRRYGANIDEKAARQFAIEASPYR